MSCENKTIQIKTGSAAFFGMVYTDHADVPIPLDGYEIYMDFREAKTGKLLASTSIGNGIIITEIAGDDTTTGTYQVNAGSTAGWQLGDMPVDILYVHSDIGQHTEDFILDIGQGRTQIPVTIGA